MQLANIAVEEEGQGNNHASLKTIGCHAHNIEGGDCHEVVFTRPLRIVTGCVYHAGETGRRLTSQSTPGKERVATERRKRTNENALEPYSENCQLEINTYGT